MKDKDKKKNHRPEDDDVKLDIQKSVFQVNRELQKQQQEELEAKQLELEREHARREKEKREAYEKQLQDEKIQLMRMKQGIADEDETIQEEEEEEIKLSFPKKIGNFFYHNKWWLGIAVFFVALGSYLIYDLAVRPRPDMVILMLCENEAVGNSVYLEEYFTSMGEDSNGNGEVLVQVYYIPYTDDEYRNYTNGVTNKLTNFLSNADGVVIIGDKKTSDELFTPEDSFVDLSELYPDNPHVEDYYFYLKGTDFAEKLGIPSVMIGDDMFLALRKPRDIMHATEKEMQETYDKDFPTFDRVIADLTN